MPSIDKRPNGRYRARWREYPGGPQHARHFARKVDAERWLTKVRHDLMTGAYVDPSAGRATVEQWAGEWTARQHWRPATRRIIDVHLRLHILPVLGRRPLATVKRGDVESLLVGLELGAASVSQVRTTLASMFAAAVNDGLIARSPLTATRVPRGERAPAKALTDEQAAAALEAAPDWFRAAVVLGLGAGLRQGEAAGLTVDRVDFLRRTVAVDRQLLSEPGAGGPAFGPPKSAAGFRTIPVDQWVCDELAAHLAAFGPGPSGAVVHRDGALRSRTTMMDTWRQTRTRAGLADDVTFHALRHTFASTLLSAGVSIKAVSGWLGHSSAAITLSTYAHVMPGDDERGRAVIAAAAGRWSPHAVLRRVNDAERR